jgi:hypothetical protein
VSAEHRASILSRTAAALETSAALAEDHADRHALAGRNDDAAQERQAADRARQAARRARSRAEQWLERTASREP